MPNTTNKLHINDTMLFKQVASVLGKGRALEELLRACRTYKKDDYSIPFNFNNCLLGGFTWGKTAQGFGYWKGVEDVYNNQINNR
tara:strand:- start:260 stop:514 length:255 start_codon:yes stop_codon:yes gene_type:complete